MFLRFTKKFSRPVHGFIIAVLMIIAPAVVANETVLAAGIAVPVPVAANAASGCAEATCFSSAAVLLEVTNARAGAAPAASFCRAIIGDAVATVAAATVSRDGAAALPHATASAPSEPAATRMPVVRRV